MGKSVAQKVTMNFNFKYVLIKMKCFYLSSSPHNHNLERTLFFDIKMILEESDWDHLWGCNTKFQLQHKTCFIVKPYVGLISNKIQRFGLASIDGVYAIQLVRQCIGSPTPVFAPIKQETITMHSNSINDSNSTLLKSLFISTNKVILFCGL